MATSKSLRKFKPGAMVRSKVRPERIFVMDSERLFHCGDEKVTDLDVAALFNTHPEIFEVVSEGVDMPVKEPQGLGAVVDVEYDDGTIIRWVRVNTDSTAGACWRATGGGLASWGWWEDGKLTVRHEGWNEQ